MHVTSAESTELFAGPPDAPLQLVRVRFRGRSEAIRVEGDGLRSEGEPRFPEPEVAEVPVEVDDPVPGQQRDARVVVNDDATAFGFVVAEPGWTMYMISHFHYDPVWWNTQGAYTSEWNEDPPGRQMNGFALVHAHLEMARREQEYKFVLAEVDYLKPYWDACPEDREDLRRLIADGRLEIMGGAYNEPNTNLTSPETTIRNFVHGMGFQRDIMGAEPATAWQLDVFGHDPQFPGMAADAGLTSSSWARGPHHQWGPMTGDRDPRRMQFSSEFEWIAPSGRGLLTHYMPAHYGAGWGMDSSPTLQKAEEATYKLFESLKKVALTRNVLLPVGTDYTPPNKWVTEIHRDWNARYTWPRFISALPREFFAAVRKELDEKGIAASPQTRDMNPIYTGKDVSYIDTKQANRAAETAVLDAERLAVFACLLGGATYPQAALEKSWVQLAYGAHHDAITGSESDQVYLDLLTGWRDAWELGRAARDNSLALLSSAVDGSVAVWNTLAHNRTDIITARLSEPLGNGVRVLDADGQEVPSLVEHGRRSVSWLARDVPSMGWRAYRLAAARAEQSWEPLDGNEIANEHYRLTVDPGRGGAVSSLVDLGSEHELVADGGAGNEVAVYDEYSTHPHSGEGPWHLIPKGPVIGSATFPAESVQAFRCPLGQRIVVRGRIGKLLRYNQILTLWDGVARVDCRTTIDGFTEADRLIRLRWPCPVPGALPVSEVGDAVIGRGFGLLHEPGARTAVDTKDHPWTLDNPAYGWFGLSSTARVRAGDSVRAMSVAEVVTPSEATSAALARDLMVALVRAGVTATCSSGDRSRYGALDVDSNLPDTRIAVGGPDENAFTAEVLAAADAVYADEVKRQLYANGVARVWVPAAAPLTSEWVPDADLRGVRTLPVLVIAATDLAKAVAAVVDDLADAEIVVAQDAPTGAEPFEQRTVALLNRGVPGFAVEPDGTLHASLMRSCTGWPSGTWIDEPRRTAPDGSNFQEQHWTHVFDYAVVSGDGDWRAARLPTRNAEYSHSLLVAPAGRENGGGLPSFGSLLEVEPADSVLLGAVKPAGNPLASGRSAPVDPAKAVAVRLVECCGSSTGVQIRSGLRKVALSSRVDLLEEPLARQAVSNALTLHGFEIATVLARFNLPKVLDADHTSLAPDTEAAQPLYARYWLHNRGPAPMGGLPAVTYLNPPRVTAEPDASVVVRLTAASDCTDAALHGKVRMVCPDGWTASPPELPFVLPPGEHLEADVEIAMPSDAPSGVYPVRAELSVTGSDLTSIPPAWRQTVEDVCLVIVEPAAAHHWNLTAFRRRGRVAAPEVLRLVREPEAVEVAAGCSARLAITVGTDARADLAAEAHLISPWGTWEWMGPAAIGATVPAQGQVNIEFDVAPPEWVEPGEWWALIRVGCAGRLLYTPAVKVTVR
ncbi:MAG: hypothetical protein QOH60_5079 [Mycobacterium sp.]|nr:hypothetical protein [Mycobacterium sp.]